MTWEQQEDLNSILSWLDEEEENQLEEVYQYALQIGLLEEVEEEEE